MIRVGIIGAGYFGEAHARAIAETDGVELVAACRNDAEGIIAFTDAFGGRGYTDYLDLLADDEVDAVVIASPHHLHEQMAIDAARAGKHILLEKPLAPTLEACAAVNDAVAAAGVKMLVGHVPHFMRHNMVAKQIIEAGTYGRPVAGNARMIKQWMQSNRRDWHLSPETGGGMLMTAGIHMLDALVWLMGSKVAGVSALSGSLQHGQDVDDTALITLRFGNGTIGQVQSVGYVDGAGTTDIDIICERATLKIDAAGGVRVGQGEKWTLIEGSSEADSAHHGLIRQWESLRDSVVTGAPIAIDGVYATHLIAVVQAAHEANGARREIAPAA